MPYIVEMLNITKDFPGIRANDNITMQIEKGSVHALLGENGAGKSTLMSILFGLYQSDAGIIKIRGSEVKITDPNIATKLGIGMVHQHFKLVHNFTVTENIILGLEPHHGPVLNMKKAVEKVKELSQLYALNVDPYAKIEDISVGMQQRVEILKMLYRNAEILIFDEPTAVLIPQEIQELMEIMRRLIVEGKTILLITHKLKEIKAVADKCTVLRRGRYIGTVDVKNVSESELAEMMVGRELNFKVEKQSNKTGPVVLKIDKLCVKNTKGLLAVKNVSLTVKSGEILGLCGIDGNGQTEFIQAIAGLQKIDSGNIFIHDKNIAQMSVRQRLDSGLGHIPEDRQKHGLILDFKLDENMVIHTYYKKPFSNHGVLDFSEIYSNAERLITEFDIRSSNGPSSLARSMSGGNQQKAILARELDRSPDLLIISQPTRGLDVGAIEYIHKRIIAERDNGKAILLVSLELDEIMDLSDVIAVMHRGEIVGRVTPETTDEQTLGRMMAGSMKDIA